jgi:3-oxoacyl-[acyl-carrier-protein] synthase-1/3-oxoacyl-[acyl-carrier-protein] synthase II
MSDGTTGRLPPASAVAVGAVSAFGTGVSAYRAAVHGEPARTAVAPDEELARAGLASPRIARVPASLAGAARDGERAARADDRPGRFEDRAAALLACALGQLVEALDEVRPGWRSERLGVALGTSSGGMLSAERFFARRASGEASDDLPEIARRATYFAPVDDALAAFGLGGIPRRTLLLAACAASTIAIGLGTRWLDRGACDLVIAGGFDAVSVFVAAGFTALRATTTSSPRPFRKGRDGMSLGEGAGLVALVRRGEERGARPHMFVSGFGASTDAVHITAPDPTGGGLSRAALAALRDAGQTAVDLVSAHATATPYNDAMEAKAIRAAVPGRPIVHPFKAQIGHTLGAAGVLEALSAADALARGVAPAAAGEGEMDPDADVELLPRGEKRALSRALKLSAAFGGANAALVLSAHGDDDRPSRARRPVFVTSGAHVTDFDLAALAEATGVARDRLARLDTLGRLGVSAVAALAARVGKGTLAGAGIVAGHALATLDTNDAFDAKKRARGPAAVEPRAFPATSPNAVAGECAILYKLTGPGFATGAGLDGATEALLAAAELIAAGDIDRMVVVAADDAGPVARDLLAVTGLASRPFARGAVALLLTADPGAHPVDLDALPRHDHGPIGHLALLPWL